MPVAPGTASAGGGSGGATETTQASILAELQQKLEPSDLAALSTAAKQDLAKGVLDSILTSVDGLEGYTDGIEASLTSLLAKDFATQTTLAAVLTELGQKLEPSDLSLLATAAKQDASKAVLDSILTDLGGTLTTNVTDRVARLLGHVTVDNFPSVQPVSDNGASLTVDGSVSVSNFPATQPVSGPLTDTQLRATRVPVDGSGVTQPVSAAALPLPTGASTESTLATVAARLSLDADGNLPVTVMSALIPREFDYISLSYTGSDLTGVVYKQGGSGGTTVAMLTLAYTTSILTSVTRT